MEQALIEALAGAIVDRGSGIGGIAIDLSSDPHLLERVAMALGSAVADVSPIDLVYPASRASFRIAVLFSKLYGVPMAIRNKGAGGRDDGFFAAAHGQTCLVIHHILLKSVDPVLETVEHLAAAGIKVLDVVALIDGEKGGREVLLKHGLRFHSATTWKRVRGFLAKRAKERKAAENDRAEERKLKTPENRDVVAPRRYFPRRSVRDRFEVDMIGPVKNEGHGRFASRDTLAHGAASSSATQRSSAERLEAGMASVKLEGFAESVRSPTQKPAVGNTVSSGRSRASAAQADDDAEKKSVRKAEDLVFQTPERHDKGDLRDGERRRKRFRGEDNQGTRQGCHAGECSSAPNVQASHHQRDFAGETKQAWSSGSDSRKRPWDASKSSDAQDCRTSVGERRTNAQAERDATDYEEFLGFGVAGRAYAKTKPWLAHPAAGSAARARPHSGARTCETYAAAASFGNASIPQGNQAAARPGTRGTSRSAGTAITRSLSSSSARTETTSYDSDTGRSPNRRIPGAGTANGDERDALVESWTRLLGDKATAHASVEATLDDGLMTVALLKHQRTALNWMIYCETRKLCSGGFLADDQGLGKTVSAIALILKTLPQCRFLKSRMRNDSEDVKRDVKPERRRPLKREPDVKRDVKLEPEPELKPDVEPDRRGGTLIVCPTSLLRQWVHEIETKVATSANVSSLVYYGRNREILASEIARYDIVLTTYAIVRMEVPSLEEHEEDPDDEDDDEDDGDEDDEDDEDVEDDDDDETALCQEFGSSSSIRAEPVPEQYEGPLAEVSWFRVVLDEAHYIKNAGTQTSYACAGLTAEKRWCLSAMPIQNSIDDLFSYFRFLRFSPFDNYTLFKEQLMYLIYTNPEKGYGRLQMILQIVMLQRTQDAVIEDEPVLQLPLENVNLQKVEFSREESESDSREVRSSRSRTPALDVTAEEHRASVKSEVVSAVTETIPWDTETGAEPISLLGWTVPTGTRPAQDINRRRHRCYAADVYSQPALEPELDDTFLRSILERMTTPGANEEADVDEGLMRLNLLKHQRLALAWMIQRENRTDCPGGILADDQGLGKTVSTIALILKARAPLCQEMNNLKMEDNARGGTLVVCPTSVLRQWANEIGAKVAAAANVSTCVYHGPNRLKCPDELAKFDIVLTTYSIVTMEVPSPAEDQTSTCSARRNREPGTLAQVSWLRVVLDEAQFIKNARTRAAKACWGLKAEKRWCLSGTPIQNSVDDLFSYFRFLRFAPFDNYTTFRTKVKNEIAANPRRGYQKLQMILQLVMLRRLKDTHIDGEPILRLPPRNVTIEQTEFWKQEREFYDSIERSSRAQFEMYASQGSVDTNYMNILALILRLRQACCHRLLSKSNAKLLAETSTPLCAICEDVSDLLSRCGHAFCARCVSDKILTNEAPFNECPVPGCTLQLNRSLVPGLTPLSFEEPVISSSKIEAVMDRLQRLPVLSSGAAGKKATTEKALVFSQWTGFLDLLEPHLLKAGLNFQRLDGKMTVMDRDAAVRDFHENPETSVMLMSLKAGSLGLNMAAASHVLLLDLWWNPAVEDQAIDRAHRIGQTRPVHVSQFTVKDTIEDRILALQERKRQIVSSAFGEDNGRDQQNRLTLEELRFLFG